MAQFAHMIDFHDRAIGLTADERLLRDTVREFVLSLDEAVLREDEESQTFNPDVYASIVAQSLHVPTLPENLGGPGLEEGMGINPMMATVIVNEGLAYVSPSYAMTALADGLLFGHNLHINGNADQQERFLPRIASGDLRGGVAMTEPDSGTNLFNMRTRAERVDGGWVVNGEKRFITNGDADVFILYAKTGEGPRDITSFIVDGTAEPEGFRSEGKEDKSTMRSSPTYSLVFENCFIHDYDRLSEVHDGWRGMLRNLAIERLGLAAEANGTAMRCLDDAFGYSLTREGPVPGEPTITLLNMTGRLGEAVTNLHTARHLAYNVARHVDAGDRDATHHANMAKSAAATYGTQIALACIDAMGGNGLMAEYGAVRRLNDIILHRIGGGTLDSHYTGVVRDMVKFDARQGPGR